MNFKNKNCLFNFSNIFYEYKAYYDYFVMIILLYYSKIFDN